MIEAKIDKNEIIKLQAFFKATSRELEAASNAALRDTIRWIKSQLIKKTANSAKIQQKPLTQKTSKGTSRLWFSTNKTDKSARLWFGVRRISLGRLNPKQHGKRGTKGRRSSRAGVSAGVGGSIFREGAFLMPISKKNGEAAIVPYQVMKRAGKDRLPIIKQVYDYGTHADQAAQEIIPKIPEKLTENLRKKLKWQTGKR